MKRRVGFVSSCLLKGPSWSNKKLEWPIARQRKDRQGCQAERINRGRNLGVREEEE